MLHFFVFVVFFLLEKDLKRKKTRMLRSRQFNSIQNYVCFSLLGQKLTEKMDLYWPKCNFSEEGKHTS